MLNVDKEAQLNEQLAAYRAKHVPLYNLQPLKLGLFAINVNGTIIMSSAPSSFEVSWAHTLEIAQLADRMGLEVILPVARWRGFGGETNWNGTTYETLTYAAGLAACTKNIMTFSTLHVPLVHPVMAAKALATIDHISGGRAGLNIVMGWYEKEMWMFGTELRAHDDRYAYGAEWTNLLQKLWSAAEPFDYKGTYFSLDKCESSPKPIQPRAVLINAGASSAGIDFSARYADFNFASFTTADHAARYAKAIRERARTEYRRDIGLVTLVVLVCRDSEAEAKAAYQAIVDHGDWAAAENFKADLSLQSGSFGEHLQKELLAKFVVGVGGHSLVGTPEQVVDGLKVIRGAGIDCVVLGFLDYREELKYFHERVMPLMRQAGLRL